MTITTTIKDENKLRLVRICREKEKQGWEPVHKIRKHVNFYKVFNEQGEFVRSDDVVLWVITYRREY